MRRSPVVCHQDAANEQHYEVPPAFFALMLGPRLKYSACLWGPDTHTLDRAERDALDTVCHRADLRDGQRVLELGCGWGSLTLHMARRFPRSTILAVSNSAPQREWITAVCRRDGLDNVRVVTADIAEFAPEGRFDRVVSVEMFEHVRNWEALLARVATWLTPDGALFLHVFCHRTRAYPFRTTGPGNWMGRNFFTGGLMPSYNLAASTASTLRVEESWVVPGHHYARTARAWLSNLDSHADAAAALLADGRGERHGRRALQRWRIFLMACEELFGFSHGKEWHVAHHLLRPRSTS